MPSDLPPAAPAAVAIKHAWLIALVSGFGLTLAVLMLVQSAFTAM